MTPEIYAKKYCVSDWMYLTRNADFNAAVKAHNWSTADAIAAELL